MTNILNKINSLFPISDDTVHVLKENVTCCRFPKKYQLIKADTYCKSAFFIEKGITRSFWLVDGEEVTTSFAGEGSIVFSMDELYYGKICSHKLQSLTLGEYAEIGRRHCLLSLGVLHFQLCLIRFISFRVIHIFMKTRFRLPVYMSITSGQLVEPGGQEGMNCFLNH